MKYRDQRVTDKDGNVKKNIIINGTTTIVFGESETDVQLYNRVIQILYDTMSVLTSGTVPVVTKGVAKLAPGDLYDEKTGIKIASRKAEIKGRLQEYNRLVDALNLVEKVGSLLETEIDNIGNRLQKVVDELNEEIESLAAEAHKA